MVDPKELERRKQIARVRFAVISPLLLGNYSEPSKAKCAARLAQHPVKMPDGNEQFFSPKTILRWEYIYRTEGYEGLMPRTRCDQGMTRSIPAEAQEEIRRIIEDFPRLSASQIRERLVSQTFLEPTVSLSSVQRYLAKLREEEKFAANAVKKERRAFEAGAPNSLWQADTGFTYPIVINGKHHRTYTMIILDDYSRLITGARVFLQDNALNFQKLLKDSIKTYGIPTRLLTDNGAPYANEQLLDICSSVGTVLIRAKPHDPQSKGKVERVIRTMRDQFLATLHPEDITDLEDFNQRLNAWVRTYNTTEHSTTQMTPKKRFTSSTKPLRRPSSDTWLEQCFLNRVTRKVRNDSTVQFLSICWDVPSQFVGQKVEIRFSPEDPTDNAFIVFGDDYLQVRPTDRIANGKAHRSEPVPLVNYALEAQENKHYDD